MIFDDWLTLNAKCYFVANFLLFQNYTRCKWRRRYTRYWHLFNR